MLSQLLCTLYVLVMFSVVCGAYATTPLSAYIVVSAVITLGISIYLLTRVSPPPTKFVGWTGLSLSLGVVSGMMLNALLR